MSASDLPRSPGHPFRTRLNLLLAENGFDALVERLCAPSYAETMGRPGVPPGVFFRMFFVGYFEGLKSHREISWRCTDRTRSGKTVSNDDWKNPHDPDATITRMKDGTTRLAYKAEHAGC